MVHRVQTQSASVRGVMVMLLLDLMLVIKWRNVTQEWKWLLMVCCYFLN